MTLHCATSVRSGQPSQTGGAALDMDKEGTGHTYRQQIIAYDA